MSKSLSKQRRALILFSSHPIREQYRKHLTSDIQRSIRLYNLLLSNLFQQIDQANQAIEFDLIVASDPYERGNMKALSGAYLSGLPCYFVDQQGSGFGERLQSVFTAGLLKDYDQVCVIGNDSPDISASHLVDAFSALATSDAVLGPAKDGGVYLLGLTDFSSEMLNGVHWCSSAVKAQLAANFTAAGMQLTELDVLCDIDDCADLQSWLGTGVEYSALKEAISLILVLNLLTHYFLHAIPYRTNATCLLRDWQLPPPSQL